jgi:ADP-heptose:LPS heptosyltransferase
VYEPIAYPISLWWRIILWCARRRAGSIEVRYQTHGYERPVPQGVLQRVYDCAQVNLFDTPETILNAWGIEVRTLPHPAMPPQPSPEGKPYLVFHFFAGALRRTIPVDHARAILMAARAAYPSHAFILTCAQNERERAEVMAEGISDTRIESDHSARELIALLCGADLTVGTTSGIILTAACLQRPIVALHCMSHGKAFMPDFSPNTTVLAALNECRCRPGDGSKCPMMTDDGPVYRCLYYIPTEEVLGAMKKMLPGI